MSSRGALFTTESLLPKGARIELTVSWPAKLNDAVPLNLVATGVLVRAGAKQAAIAMERYEFRTRGASLEEPRGEPWPRMDERSDAGRLNDRGHRSL